jgi:hypothetical protein
MKPANMPQYVWDGLNEAGKHYINEIETRRASLEIMKSLKRRT